VFSGLEIFVRFMVKLLNEVLYTELLLDIILVRKIARKASYVGQGNVGKPFLGYVA
jgi:hypothetical protein